MRRSRPTTVLLALAIGLAACGGGDAPAAPPAAADDGGAVGADEPASDDEGPDGTEHDAAGAGSDGPTATQDGAQDRATGAAPAVPAAHDWSAPTVDGDTLDLATLADGPVVLWMWAPWCSVCNREAPEVVALLDELPDGVTIVGVAGRDDLAPMQDFVARHGLQDMVHAVDVDGSLWARYGVSYQPAWVFITPDGEAAVAAGALGRDGVLSAVDEVFGT